MVLLSIVIINKFFFIPDFFKNASLISEILQISLPRNIRFPFATAKNSFL
jgi:hypothetical protein